MKKILHKRSQKRSRQRTDNRRNSQKPLPFTVFVTHLFLLQLHNNDLYMTGRKCIPYNKGSDSLRLYFLESEATAALLFHISLKHCLCH